jgi:hypothetical protein
VTEWLNWGANIRKVLSPAATKVCMLAEVTLPSWFMRNTQSDTGTATRLPVLRSVSTWQFVQLTTWRTWQALQSRFPAWTSCETVGEVLAWQPSHFGLTAPGCFMETYSVPSPCTSPAVWQSMHCIPARTWTSSWLDGHA